MNNTNYLISLHQPASVWAASAHAPHLSALSRSLLGEFWDDLIPASAARLSAASDLEWDAEKREYRGEIALPGFKREEVTVEVAPDGTITVVAESEKRGRVERSWFVEGVDAEKVAARLEHGVLALTLPLTEATRARKITVA